VNQPPTAKRRVILAATGAALLVVLATVLAPLSVQLQAYAQGLAFAVLAGLSIMTVAFLVALPLGALAASGPRVIDWALRFACDLVGSLPTVFVAAVFWAGTSSLSSLVGGLGLLRGLEQAWLLRCEIVRLEAEDPEAAPRSLGRSPLLPFLRRRMLAALGPLFVSASFSVAWLTALDAAVSQAGLRPPGAPTSWGVLLGAPHPSPIPALLAAGSVAWLTVALHALFRPPSAVYTAPPSE